MEKNIFFEYEFERTGFNTIVNPENSPLKYISSGTLTLINDSNVISTKQEEMGLFCIKGNATVETETECKAITKYDGLFMSPNSRVKVTANNEVQLVWFSTPSNMVSTPQILYFDDIKKDQDTYMIAGEKENSTKREVHQIISKKVNASRLLAGITIGDNGSWTSWPPHEHGDEREELYIFFDMPYPQFGIQMVYSKDITNPEVCKIVRNGSAVAVPDGFHPNVAGPDTRLSYIFIMASLKENEGRNFSKVNFDDRFMGGK